MRNLFVLSALLIGTASLSANAAPSVSMLLGSAADTSAIQQVREASEGPRRSCPAPNGRDNPTIRSEAFLTRRCGRGSGAGGCHRWHGLRGRR